jgi:hypothetical protein
MITYVLMEVMPLPLPIVRAAASRPGRKERDLANRPPWQDLIPLFRDRTQSPQLKGQLCFSTEGATVPCPLNSASMPIASSIAMTRTA